MHQQSRTAAQAVRTDFLGYKQAAQLISTIGIIECLHGMAQRIESDFARWEDFEKSARVANHSRDGVIELMPVSDENDYAFKYVNGHPINTSNGLPTVMAFGALANVANGVPVFVSELTLITALRTAATSAMAARKLMRNGSRTMALIGNGSQSEFQALAFHGLLGIRELRLFDTDPAATCKLVDNLKAYPIDVVVCESTADAVRGADVVTTVTADKAYATILHAGMVQPGMHINAVGGDCPGKTELAPEVLQRAEVFVEFEPQTRIEGDIQQMPADFRVTEFWRVVQGLAPGRTSEQEVTVFDSVGFALEDYSALRYMRGLAATAGTLQTLDLIPSLDNPKDLFAMLRHAQAAAGHHQAERARQGAAA